MPDEILNQSIPDSVVAEKMLSQAEVNAIVGAARREGYEKARRDLDGQPQANQQTQQSQPSSNHGLSAADIERIIEEKTNRLRDESAALTQNENTQRAAKQMVNDFNYKLNTGKDEYEDFDQVVGDVDFSKIPQIVQLATLADNTAGIVYELSKNPSKIGALLALVNADPRMAMREVAALSKSISNNKNAEQSIQSRDPLSKIKPASPNLTNGGQLSVAELRRRK